VPELGSRQVVSRFLIELSFTFAFAERRHPLVAEPKLGTAQTGRCLFLLDFELTLGSAFTAPHLGLILIEIEPDFEQKRRRSPFKIALDFASTD
jgi:hypothetical protein